MANVLQEAAGVILTALNQSLEAALAEKQRRQETLLFSPQELNQIVNDLQTAIVDIFPDDVHETVAEIPTFENGAEQQVAAAFYSNWLPVNRDLATSIKQGQTSLIPMVVETIHSNYCKNVDPRTIYDVVFNIFAYGEI